MNKYIYIGFACLLTVLSALFCYYYNTSQTEIKALYGNVETLKTQKDVLKKDIEEQTKQVNNLLNDINKKQEKINILEKKRQEVRQEISKLKIKLEKRDFDKIILSSESRKKKVEDVLKVSTFNELKSLEEITQKISKVKDRHIKDKKKGE